MNLKERKKRTKNSEQKNLSNKKVLIISCIVGGILLIALIFSTIFSLINLNNTHIISKVKINGINIGNLSKDEAIQKITEAVNKKLEGDILIKSGEFEYGIKLSQIETSYNIEKAIEEAYTVGRNANIFKNNYEILNAILIGKDVNLEYTYNEELLNNILKDISVKVPDAVTEVSYSIEEENKLIITPGKAGNSIDEEAVKKEIINQILNQDENIVINVDLIHKEAKSIDIDEIYESVHTEPQDAYYTKDPFQVFPHVNGVDFDIEAAREIIKEQKEEYIIELKITVPKVTTSQIGTEAFPDLLSTFSTRYDASNVPRTTNLKLAMNKLDGTVVAPGETFSYNKTLGKRTAEAGYREAGGFAGGRVVQTLAGGICQISSTLYDAVVYANLDIIERHNHMFLAGYVGAGKDATVVYGSLDLKFKNTRNYPIMIKTSIGSGIAKVSIYGIKEDVEYDVDIVTNTLSYSTYKVIYENDSSLAEGQEKVAQNGMNGCKSITYKVLKLNGAEVSRSVLSSDTYDPMNKIIKVGAKKSIETSSTPEPQTQTQETPAIEPTPEPAIEVQTSQPEQNTEQAQETPPQNTEENSGNTGNEDTNI